MSMKIAKTVLLIWLDASINEGSIACQDKIIHLRRVVNHVNTFTDGDQCMQFLKEVQNEKVCLVISGSLGQHIVPRVHDMCQVDSIFIFCGNKDYHEQWAKEWSKVKGVYTDIKLTCAALKQCVQDREQNAIDFSLLATDDDPSNMDLDRLDPMFMYTQIIKEILLVIPFEQKHIGDFFKYCREILKDDRRELRNIDKLERSYHKRTPIWWYTWESFLYPMLNQALRLSNFDMIVKMGFFIGDLHRQIAELHSQQCRNSDSDRQFLVYRGQGMSRKELGKISKTKGGLLAFNNFLSTSRTESVSIDFAERALLNPESVGVLFEMKIDSDQSTAPFVSVAGVGAHGDSEDEILFAMHTLFRIEKVQQMDGNTRLFRIELQLTKDNDEHLQVLTKRIHEEIFPNDKGWERMGLLLLKLGRPTQAEVIYRTLLDQESDESQMGHLYNQLGLCRNDQGDYEEAIRLYQKSIAIDQEYFPNDSNLDASYNNVASVYYNMGEYAKALSLYKKSLAIRQQSLPPNHSDLAESYNNIGNVYDVTGDYVKALSSYEQSLAIKQQSLPYNHPHLASCYNNIGNAYFNMDEDAKALSFYKQSLTIKQQALPTNHPDLALSYSNIGNVCHKMGEYAEALSFYEQSLAIQEESLPVDHPHLASSYNNMGEVYFYTDEMTKALSFHEKALRIWLKSYPPNHPYLAESYNNFGLVYEKMNDFSKACWFYAKAVKISEQSLPPNHVDLQKQRNNLDRVKNKL